VSISKNGFIFSYGDIGIVSIILIITTMIIFGLLDFFYFTRIKSRMEVYNEVLKNPNITEELKRKGLNSNFKGINRFPSFIPDTNSIYLTTSMI